MKWKIQLMSGKQIPTFPNIKTFNLATKTFQKFINLIEIYVKLHTICQVHDFAQWEQQIIGDGKRKSWIYAWQLENEKTFNVIFMHFFQFLMSLLSAHFSHIKDTNFCYLKIFLDYLGQNWKEWKIQKKVRC